VDWKLIIYHLIMLFDKFYTVQKDLETELVVATKSTPKRWLKNQNY